MRYRIRVTMVRYLDMEVEARSEEEVHERALEAAKRVPVERWDEYLRVLCLDDFPPSVPAKLQLKIRWSEEPELPEGEFRPCLTRVSEHRSCRLTVEAPTKREALRRVAAPGRAVGVPSSDWDVYWSTRCLGPDYFGEKIRFSIRI